MFQADHSPIINGEKLKKTRSVKKPSDTVPAFLQKTYEILEVINFKRY